MINNKQIHQLTLESLRDWFKKEKWVRISSSGKIAGPCGTSKNKKNPDRCLPKAKAQSLTKSQRAATAAKKKKAGKKGKTVVKNTKKATVKKETKGAPKGHYFTKSGNLVKGRLTQDARERGARLSDPKDKQRSKVPPVTQYNELELPSAALTKINSDVKNAKTMALSILQYIDAVDDKEQPAIFKNSKLRRAIELLKDLGDDQEEVQEIDINDPALMKARAMKIKRAKQKQASKPRGISYEDALDLRLKLQDLEDERADVLRNMEQEAEPEGGPIADDYGAILNDLDKKINSIMNKLQQYDMNETANPQDGKAAPFGSGFKKVNEMTIEDIKNLTVGLLHEIQGKEVLMEKDDRCTRIAKRKYDTWPSAYASGAVVRCRRGEIWKGQK
jgi:hypothetical protein